MLSAARAGRRFVVAIDGRPIALTATDYEALCLLACRSLQEPNQWIDLPAMTLSRLRRSLDQGAGVSGLGRELIETLGNGDYRLRADRVHIGRTADFASIPSPGFLSAEVKAAVLALCPVW